MFCVCWFNGGESESSSVLTGHLQSDALEDWTHRLSHCFSCGGLLQEIIERIYEKMDNEEAPKEMVMTPLEAIEELSDDYLHS